MKLKPNIPDIKKILDMSYNGPGNYIVTYIGEEYGVYPSQTYFAISKKSFLRDLLKSNCELHITKVMCF